MCAINGSSSSHIHHRTLLQNLLVFFSQWANSQENSYHGNTLATSERQSQCQLAAGVGGGVGWGGGWRGRGVGGTLPMPGWNKMTEEAFNSTSFCFSLDRCPCLEKHNLPDRRSGNLAFPVVKSIGKASCYLLLHNRRDKCK